MPAESAAALTTPLVPWGTAALAVIFIAVVTAVMIWMMLRIAKDSERREKDSRFRARKLRGGTILYSLSLLFGIGSVIRGEPARALVSVEELRLDPDRLANMAGSPMLRGSLPIRSR